MATFYLDFESGTDLYRDWSINDRTLTPTTVSLSSTPKKFGNYSLDTRSGATSTSLVTSTGTGYNFGAGQFTIEGWYYFDTHSGTASEALITMWGGNNLGWAFSIHSNVLSFQYSTTGADSLTVSAAYTPPTGQWVHFAVDRDASNVIRLYVNGAVLTSATVASTFFASTQNVYVGNVNGNGWSFKGYVGEVRVSKGVARYAGAFTPPNAAFPRTVLTDPYYNASPSVSVALLLQFDGDGSGSTFQDRWRTITTGASAARIAPGDTIRIMGSPPPTLVGNALWAQYSKTITLAAAVTANISDCETAWTPSTSVTINASTSQFKEGTRGMQFSIAAAFTTGKIAYFPTGTLDLSGYQQVSFWFLCPLVTLAAGTFTLRLCSDTAGAVTVNTIPLPAMAGAGQWIPVAVDMGASLGSGIQSVALYAETDPGTVIVYLDNIIACKASSAPDSLTLTSLIGKVCNLSWIASTAYTTGDERKPTQPNRNGFRYKATTGGTTGSTEPIWPQEIGVTVTDGAVIWICVGLEDTWFGIQSINGTTVKLDNAPNTAGNAGRGYSGSTETVATYKRETIKTTMVSPAGTAVASLQVSGTDALPITYSGGWDRAAMTVQSGETWLDGQNGFGNAINGNSKIWAKLFNLNGVRYSVGIFDPGVGIVTACCHWNCNTTCGFQVQSLSPFWRMSGLVANNNGTNGFNNNNPSGATMAACSFEGNGSNGLASNIYRVPTQGNYVFARNNGSYGISHGSYSKLALNNLVTGNNGVGGVIVPSAGTEAQLMNSLLPETTAVTSAGNDQYIYSQKHNQIADNHLITTDGGTIISAVDQRHTLSGIAWKFRPTATTRNSAYPLKLSLGQRLVKAGVPVSVTIWTRRDNANIKGQLVVAGGQVAGVPNDVVVDCQPAVNAWEISNTLTFTPSETGVVGISFKVFDGVTTTSNLWVDDLAVTGA